MQEEERIANALRYKEIINLLISLRKLGEMFDVYYIKLFRRMKGISKIRLNYEGYLILLDSEQEAAVFQILDRYVYIDILFILSLLRGVAYRILYRFLLLGIKEKDKPTVGRD